MNSELEKLKNELEQAINDPNVEIEKVFEIASNIDKNIEVTYIKNDNNSNIEDKYKNIFDRNDKAEILIQIKSDILDRYKNISIIELEMLSNNIYDFCCLKVHQISKEEISKYVSYKNKCYYEKFPDKKKDKLSETNYKQLKTLTEKYVKILKSNKQSVN